MKQGGRGQMMGEEQEKEGVLKRETEAGQAAFLQKQVKWI
jgi:hypothetical protein